MSAAGLTLLAGLALHPVLLLQPQLELQDTEDAGENGYGLARARLGARVEWSSRVTAVVTAELAIERPGLLDGYLVLRPLPMLALAAGLAKSPLFVSGRDETIESMPINERSTLVRSFWPFREVGAEVHLLPIDQPIEAWARASNGTSSVLGNDLRSGLAFDGRVDLVLGRARRTTESFGLRLGGGLRFEDAGEKAGIGGANVTGFPFYRAPVISGRRLLAEGHLLVYYGPLRFLVEAALAHESRSVDDDGNPTTPRRDLDAISSRGASTELAWMFTGQQRQPGTFVSTATTGGIFDQVAGELAVRAERLVLGRGAEDVLEGGATGLSAAVNAWAWGLLGVSLQLHWLAYDLPPLELPEAPSGWVALLRLTLALR